MKRKLHFMRAAVSIFLFFVILMVILGAFIYHAMAEVMKRQMGNYCLGIAEAATVVIEQDIEGFQNFCTTLDTDSEYYRRVKPQLEKIRYGNDKNIRFLYVEIRRSENEIMYILDGEKEGDEYFAPPGSTDVPSLPQKQAYDTETAHMGTEFVKGTYGELLISFAPICDEDGRFYGMVGVDVSIEQYNRVMRYQLIITVASLVLLSLLMVVLSFGLIRLYNEKQQSDKENRSKSSFLARMSHEIRTPMNAIVGMSELMLREELSPSARVHAQSVQQASENLLAIINDILDLSKIESGKVELIAAPYQLKALLSDIISVIRMRLLDKQVAFAVNIDSKIPGELIGDDVHLRQIMMNVLSNAVKYTEEGSVLFGVEGEYIDEHNYKLVIKVTDTGIGIKDEDKGKLFGDFAQVDVERNKNVQGTGLGLAIAKNLCEAMGGSIAVESQYGVGSTFTVVVRQQIDAYVPFAQVEEANRQPVLIYETRKVYADSLKYSMESLDVKSVFAATNSEFLEQLQTGLYRNVFVASFIYDSAKRMIQSLESERTINLIRLSEYGDQDRVKDAHSLDQPIHTALIADVLNGVHDHTHYRNLANANKVFTAPEARVLIVDDVSTNLSVTEGLLAPFEMMIDCAKSGAEAIALIKKKRYDLVLMDHMMPEMDGIEATEKIRAMAKQDQYYQDLPIVALTANAIFGMKDMFLQNGMDDFLAKPIETAKLYTILEKWIPKEKQHKTTKTVSVTASPEQTTPWGMVDVNKGIAMIGGSEESYRQIMEVFYQDCLEKAQQIPEAMQKDDLHLFTTHVHALKSASASVGASDFSESAKRLEKAGKMEEKEVIANSLLGFLEDLDKLTEEVAEYLSNAKVEAAAEVSEDDLELLETQLTALKESLVSIDIKVTDEVIANLRTKHWSKEVQESLEKLYQFVLLFEYENAMTTIDMMLIRFIE